MPLTPTELSADAVAIQTAILNSRLVYRLQLAACKTPLVVVLAQLQIFYIVTYLFAAQHTRRFDLVRFQFTTSLSAAVQQVRVHDIVVVWLQCRPEIIFTDVCCIAVQTAGALTLIAAP